jgi:soluble lytic murein transglycosylase-like protein
MAVQLGLSPAPDHFLKLRTGAADRRRANRGAPRGVEERRRGERRRQTIRSLMLASLTLGVPHPVPSTNMKLHLPPPPAVVRRLTQAEVRVSVDSFVAVPPGRAYTALIREAATRYHVDPVLIRSVMQAESAFNPIAVSRAGALGLMQLMPELAEEFGVKDPFDPRENIMAGARQLRRLLDMHGGNVTLAVASYNAGATNVARYGGIPPFEETQTYVQRVTSLLRAGKRS